jgi:hypothetical protein
VDVERERERAREREREKMVEYLAACDRFAQNLLSVFCA